MWTLLLAFLVTARLHAFFYTESPGAMLHCAAVHALEAFAFVSEHRRGAKSNAIVNAIIVANAVWFASVAFRVVN